MACLGLPVFIVQEMGENLEPPGIDLAGFKRVAHRSKKEGRYYRLKPVVAD